VKGGGKFLTPVQAADVEKICRKGQLTAREIANIYGVSIATVRRIKAGVWRPRLKRYRNQAPAQQQLQLDAPKTNGKYKCACCGIPCARYIKIETDGRAGNVCFSCVKVTLERAARKGLIDLPAAQVPFYILHPMNHWEKLDPKDPLAARIRAGEIEKMPLPELVLGTGEELADPPCPGRYFAIITSLALGGARTWKELVNLKMQDGQK